MASNLLIQEEVADIVRIRPQEWTSYRSQIIEIERVCFPPSLRDSVETLERIFKSSTSVVLGLKIRDHSGLVGYLAADRLELFAEIPGIAPDQNFGKANTLYLASVAVDAEFRHGGLGALMIRTCVDEAYVKGFKRVTAHVDSLALRRSGIRFRVKQSFGNWYGTGRKFDYIEFG